jgi:hypothetical protein
LFFLELKDKKGAGEMTEKFTQGEWFVEEKSANLHGLAWFGFQVISPEKRKRVCYSETDDKKNIPQMQANAALIAAAPEMYRMLKYLADGVRYGGIQHTNRSLAAEIENLLKKARGEE